MGLNSRGGTYWSVEAPYLRATAEEIEKLKSSIPESIRLYISNVQAKPENVSGREPRHTVTFYVLGPELHEKELLNWFHSAGIAPASMTTELVELDKK